MPHIIESNNSLLKRQLNEYDTKWQKELKAKDADLAFFKNEVKDQENILKNLHEKFNNQETELSQLKACLEDLEDLKANGWPDEKKMISNESFARAFNFYLVGFMANDPDYTFEKFGPETIAEMAQYRKKNALLIKKRRIELGLEDFKNAPSDEAVHKIIEDAPSNEEPQKNF